MVSGRWLRAGRSESGQASVELLAVVPMVVVLGWAVWQSAIAGLTAERAAHAARVAARAASLGVDTRKAIQRVLPSSLAREAAIKASAGRVTIRLRVPSVVPGIGLGTVSSTASFPEQT